jgi:hypothetical protein
MDVRHSAETAIRRLLNELHAKINFDLIIFFFYVMLFHLSLYLHQYICKVPNLSRTRHTVGLPARQRGIRSIPLLCSRPVELLDRKKCWRYRRS